MSETKSDETRHTRGPWRRTDEEILGADGSPVVGTRDEVSPCGSYGSIVLVIGAADEAIILAAPAMHEALGKVRAAFERFPSGNVVARDARALAAVFDEVDAALRAAEGVE